jgi:hypothetical protein
VRFRFPGWITPNFQKGAQIFSRTPPQDAQHSSCPFGLLVDRISIDGPLSTSAPFFSDYVVEIVVLFHRVVELRECR